MGRNRDSRGLERAQPRLDELAQRWAGHDPVHDRRGGDQSVPGPRRGGISFAAEAAYARMLHDQLAQDGVHVAHTAIAGRIAPG